MTQCANLTSLRALPASRVSATAATTRKAGPAGSDLATTATVTNTSASAVAFLLRADVRRGTASGQELPGATPVISLSGWNVPKLDVAAPAP